MPLPKAVQKQTSALTKKFDKCMNKLERLYSTGRFEEYLTLRRGEFTAIYKDACALIREADTGNQPYLTDLLDAVQSIIDEDIEDEVVAQVGCLTLKPQDYQDGPIVVEDRRMRRNNTKRVPAPVNQQAKPHPRSSVFARFGLDNPTLTATAANRSAIYVYDARCEITSVRDESDIDDERKKTDAVADMQVSAGGSCLAVLGWVETKGLHPRHHGREGKFPAPWISYHFPEVPSSKFTNLMFDRFETGLAGIPSHMTLDERQRLIFAADGGRVKSFAWAAANGTYYTRPLATHTLDSAGFCGPMVNLSNGTLVRAGTGAAAAWDIKHLETHQPGEDKIIGREIRIDSEYEYYGVDDDVPHFEYSSGSARTSVITFTDDRRMDPEVWVARPYSASTVLAAGNIEPNCIAIDLEHGGKTITRYQGYTSPVSDISVSAADPHVFVASSTQAGYVQLYDVRRPQAVLKFAACKACPVALAHPDGIPTIFTATDQDFKVWDVRARACVYELRTGDDSTANSFVWDSGHNSLFSLKSVYEEHEEDPEDGSDLYRSKYSDSSNDDDFSIYSRIYRYTFKDKPEYSILRADDLSLPPDMNDYTQPSMDDSDEEDPY